MKKVFGLFFRILFLLPVGAVGVVAAMSAWDSVGNARRAGDWVVVQARVDTVHLESDTSSGAYSYKYGGRNYVGTQLGFHTWVGDWHYEMNGFLEEARRTGRTIPVYVNPANPSESVVDRELRWGMVLVAVGLAALFGGGALLIVGIVARSLFGKRKPVVAPGPNDHRRVVRTNRLAGVLVLGVIAVAWNLITWPIAASVIRDVVMEQVEAMMLFVVLFPIAGIMLALFVVSEYRKVRRYGKTLVRFESPHLRLGERLAGHVSFSRIDGLEEGFRVTLLAEEIEPGPGEQRRRESRWLQRVESRAERDPAGGVRIPFAFDVPGRIPTKFQNDLYNITATPGSIGWSIQVEFAGGRKGLEEAFSIDLDPPEEGKDRLPEHGLLA